MKVFLATSIRHRTEALKIIRIIENNSIQVQCCLTDPNTLRGKALFEHNCKGISDSDIFVAVLKDLGRDVSTEIGIAYGLGKTRVGVLYDTTEDDLMPFFSAGELVREDELSGLIKKIKPIDKSLKFSISNQSSYDLSTAKKINEMFASRIFVEGENVKLLETKLSERYERPVIATSSGTTGLIIALNALLKERKEVIVPAISFSATAQAVIHAGAKPVFCDINPYNWNIDVEQISKKITRKTGAIIPVNLFGVPCNIEQIEKISREYNIPVIYDSCQSFGALTPAGEIGKFGMAEVFSLDATKVLNSGLGGFVTVDNKKLEERIRIGKEFGNNQNKETVSKGINGRMSEFNAILALRSLDSVEENLNLVRKNAATYRVLLKGSSRLNYQAIGNSNPAQQFFAVYVNLGDPHAAYRLRDILSSQGIGTRVYNPTLLHKLSLFEGDDYLPVAEKMEKRLLCLPNHKNISAKDQERIVGIMEENLR